QQIIHGERMNRKSLSCELTEEERLTCLTCTRVNAGPDTWPKADLRQIERRAKWTCAKWRRGRAILYGCMALLVLVFIALTTARADETSEPLYPGRYVTNCKPVPIVGCVCDTDQAGQTPPLPLSTN